MLEVMMAKIRKNDNMIPKKIHYCWFGGKPLTDFAKKCIESWKKYCPDYEIVEWNESNIDINKSEFMKEAYENKKWAFVSDYARYKIIHDNGGIYLDVDVEIIKNFDDLLEYNAFMGFEGSEYINTGLGFGAVKNNDDIKAIINIYNNIDFKLHVNNPSKISTPILISNYLKEKGFKKNGEFQKVNSITLLPEDYLCPKNPITRLTNITDNTFSIHHYDASWVDEKERKIIDDLEKKGREITNKYPDLVSIIIPVYNGEDYMKEAIDSALSQSYKNLEVIVVDDGSSDNTENIALSYGSKIRYIRKANGGVASALNQGIKSMRGKYFSWLSHDDTYHYKKIEESVKQVKQEDLNTIIITDWTIINSSSKTVKRCRLDDRLELTPRSFLAFDRKTWLNACAMLIPKELFDKVGLFDEKLRTTQDYDMHNRLIECGAKYKIIHKSLFFSRQHSKQGSLIEKDVLSNSDSIHKLIVSELSSNDIKKYFSKDVAEISKVYDSFLSNGYKETPALIMSEAVKTFANNVNKNKIVQVIQDELIGLEIKNSSIITKKILKRVSKKSKKRIMFCSGFWLTGGMERVLSNLFKEIHNDYEIILLTPFDGRVSCIEIPGDVTHIKVSSSLYYNHFDTIALSYALMLDVDVVLGFLNLFDKQLNLYNLCKNNGIKTIASNHEHYFYPYKSDDNYIKRLTKKRREVYKDLDAVLWLTNFSNYVHNVDCDNGYIMPNPNTFKVQSNIKKNNNEKVILCIGRYNDYIKRIDRILKSFSLVLEKIPKAKLIIIGKLDRDQIISQFGNQSINDLLKSNKINESNIEFVGETTEINKYYSVASLIVLTSINEGFPMVITEAACFGVPSVCCNYPGLEDVVVDGYNGYVVDQYNIEMHASCVCKLLLNDNLRMSMGKNAVKYIERFNSKAVSSRWKILIDSVINNSSKENLRNAMDENLSYKNIKRNIFDKYIIEEMNDIFDKTLLMPSSKTIIVNSRKNIRSLPSLLIREYKSNGARITLYKASKKIKKKLLWVLFKK
jgi:glycosyltransferase involved in cell wall biosynthesis